MSYKLVFIYLILHNFNVYKSLSSWLKPHFVFADNAYIPCMLN